MALYFFDTEGSDKRLDELAFIDIEGNCIWHHKGEFGRKQFQQLQVLLQGNTLVGCDPKNDVRSLRRTAARLREPFCPVFSVLNVQVIEAHVRHDVRKDYAKGRSLHRLCDQHKIQFQSTQGYGWHSARGDAFRTMLVFKAQERILGSKILQCHQVPAHKSPTIEVLEKPRQVVHTRGKRDGYISRLISRWTELTAYGDFAPISEFASQQ